MWIIRRDWIYSRNQQGRPDTAGTIRHRFLPGCAGTRDHSRGVIDQPEAAFVAIWQERSDADRERRGRRTAVGHGDIQAQAKPDGGEFSGGAHFDSLYRTERDSTENTRGD